MLLVLDGVEGWSYKPVQKVQLLQAVFGIGQKEITFCNYVAKLKSFAESKTYTSALQAESGGALPSSRIKGFQFIIWM